jgi:hypothetical protein
MMAILLKENEKDSKPTDTCQRKLFHEMRCHISYETIGSYPVGYYNNFFPGMRFGLMQTKVGLLYFRVSGKTPVYQLCSIAAPLFFLLMGDCASRLQTEVTDCKVTFLS